MFPITRSAGARHALLGALFCFALLASTVATASEPASDDATPSCVECDDKLGEHEAKDTTLYCWKLGGVIELDAQGNCPSGWRKSTIGGESQFRNRHIDICDVAAALAEPPVCDAGCFGYASIIRRRMSATSCLIEMKRDCAPSGTCAVAEGTNR
ncbi:MAG: hypothetical protein RIT81_35995 [Deltaproteobacteria bacterium]